ncbi:MAG: hypothetical protein ACLVL2_17375 [Bacteroides cellulosilyticus]
MQIAAVLALKDEGIRHIRIRHVLPLKANIKKCWAGYDISWEEGQHTEELILNAEEVVKSPGIPNDAPIILKLKKQGTPVISEIEFAGTIPMLK